MEIKQRAKRSASVFVVVCLALLGKSNFGWAADTALREASEYQLKAAFLMNFGKFTDWPTSALQTVRDFNLCVLGEDPFGSDLDKIVENQSIHSKPVRIIRLATAQDLKNCQILYVSASDEPKYRQVVSGTQRNRTLTVSDSPNFIQNGGMIQFFIEQQHVGFNVNLKVVENAGLKISSKLLQIAKVVKVDS